MPCLVLPSGFCRTSLCRRRTGIEWAPASRPHWLCQGWQGVRHEVDEPPPLPARRNCPRRRRPIRRMQGNHRVLGQACPEDPADQGGIDWVPDVMFPLRLASRMWTLHRARQGLRDLVSHLRSVHRGRPPTPRRILKHCLARWPVVLFLHGMPPCNIANYNRHWTTIPAELAAVATWSSPPARPRLPPGHFRRALRREFHRLGAHFVAARALDRQAAEAVGIVGHSYGALLGARVATARSDISACAFLSGPWGELNDRNSLLQRPRPADVLHVRHG